MMAFSEKIASGIQDYLVKQDWQHSYDALHGVFTIDAMLNCKLGSALLIFSVQEDGFLCYAALPFHVPSETRAAVGEYLHRANYGLPNGNFEFDYDEGSIHFKTWFSCPDEIVTTQQLDDSFAISLTIIDRYGDGLLELANQVDSLAKRILDALDEDVR